MLSLDPSIWSQRTLRIVSLVFLVWDQTLSANDNPKALEFGMVQMTVSARGYPRPGKTTYLALKTSLRNTDAAAVCLSRVTQFTPNSCQFLIVVPRKGRERRVTASTV